MFKFVVSLGLLSQVLSTSFISWNLPSIVDINDHLPKIEGRAGDKVPSKEEFLKTAENIVLRGLKGLTILNATCNNFMEPRSYGRVPCYAVAAGDLDKAVTKSLSMTKRNMIEYHVDAKLFNLLYLVEGDVTKAFKLINDGVDYAMLVMESDPQCAPVYHSMEELAGTMLGPGAISITESHADTVTKGWRVGTKASIYTSALFPVGSLEVSINGDYSQSIARTTTETIRRDFKAPVGAACTPSLLRVSNFCQGTKANVIYGKNRDVYQEKMVQLNQLLMPNDADHGEFFTSILGCIDYTR